MDPTPLHRAVLYLPAVTTVCAVVFCWQLFARYRAKGGGLHLLWWGIGMVTYGIGTLTEATTSILGWRPEVFRLWYVSGAFLGGYPLAQGSIYLLMNRKFADRSAWVVSSLIGVAAIFVFLTPLDLSMVETYRLSGRVIEWRWIRLISPFINLYSVFFLVGGAVLSAVRFRRTPQLRGRYVGNILIAVGALLPGIGGALTRAGLVEALYVTELAGLLLIYRGYRMNIATKAPVAARRTPAAAGIAKDDNPMIQIEPTKPLLTALAALLLAAPAWAQGTAVGAERGAADEQRTAAPSDQTQGEETPGEQDDEMQSFFASTTVTATGTKTEAFKVSTPVAVVPRREIENKLPDNAVDLLREQPGVDVNGVGPNQSRPIIRGQRGLRVLFLENGLRMNNARRQTDFGEIAGLVDMDSVESVEVVRGPASVLYGTDAIGGVLNLITRAPAWGDGSWLGGSLGLRYASASEQERANFLVEGRRDRVSFNVGGSVRDAEPYQAPSGTFGLVELPNATTVLDSGIEDDSLFGFLGFDLADSQQLSFRLNRYRADQSGFGLVDPLELGELDRIRILYPFQDFDRYTVEYLASGMSSPLAASLNVKAIVQRNERALVNEIDIYDGAGFPPGQFFHIDADTRNFTDLETLGLRLDATKHLADKHLLTYGVDYYQDESVNTDFSRIAGALAVQFAPGTTPVDVTPPFFELLDDVTNTPNATNTNWGVFVQDEFTAGRRLKATAGLRFARGETEAEATPGLDTAGLDFDDDALVGALHVIYEIRPELKLVGGVGTAFRTPNIVERLFNGPTPEGTGFQILNPDLESEHSQTFDLGLKYLRRNAIFEAIFFRTDVDDGIVQNFLSPAEIAALPPELQALIAASGARFVVQQKNVERLRYEGVELVLGYRADNGVSVGGNLTHLDSERLDSANPPTGDSFADKYNAYLRYDRPGGRFWVEYRLRHNDSTRANLDPDEPLPAVGATLPSFTVHTLSGGVLLFERGRQEHRLTVAIENLTDELYAEFSNATFFRPQPERSVSAAYRFRF